MRILVLGGGRFVGRWFATRAVEDGHDVSCLHRTAGTSPLGSREVIADRDLPFGSLITGGWDAVVDFSAYRPSQVRWLAEQMGDVGQYVLMSSTFVYDEPEFAADESAALLDADHLRDGREQTTERRDYGPLKVLCEEAAHQSFEQVTILRATIMTGPWDYSMRFPTWVKRIMNARVDGRLTVPGPKDDFVQLLDARDLSAFALHCLTRNTVGIFNIVGTEPGLTVEAMAGHVVDAIAPDQVQLTWASNASDIEQLDFPAWSIPPRNANLALSGAAALGEGFTPRSLEHTAIAVRDWLIASDHR